MKKLNSILLIAILVLSIAIYSTKKSSFDLEIYTDQNIYYVNGLTVTNESDDTTLIFNTAKELKNYISYKTANDIEY